MMSKKFEGFPLIPENAQAIADALRKANGRADAAVYKRYSDLTILTAAVDGTLSKLGFNYRDRLGIAVWATSGAPSDSRGKYRTRVLLKNTSTTDVVSTWSLVQVYRITEKAARNINPLEIRVAADVADACAVRLEKTLSVYRVKR